jgi:hypothetical protein
VQAVKQIKAVRGTYPPRFCLSDVLADDQELLQAIKHPSAHMASIAVFQAGVSVL